jgi:anthranilate synthase
MEPAMQTSFTTADGLRVVSTRRTVDAATALDGLAQRLDGSRGGLFSSGVDYPGRYSRWAFGFEDPPLELIGHDRTLTARALNARGEALLEILVPTLAAAPDTKLVANDGGTARFEIQPSTRPFTEEERSLQPSLMSPLRHLVHSFKGTPDRFLGLYGAFGYDLLFRFEPMKLKHPRGDNAKDIHLFLPDAMTIVDRRKEEAFAVEYEFSRGAVTTAGRTHRPLHSFPAAKPLPPESPTIDSDLADSEYAAMVDRARERIRVGDIFEVVLSRTFRAAYPGAPSQLYERMTRINPSPYEFLIQLGDEQLVGASPRCSCASRAAASRPARSPAPCGAARTPSRTPSRSRRCSPPQGGERAHHVHRRRPQRQVADLRARLGARHRPAPDRALLAADPHRGPRGGTLREGFDALDAFLCHTWAVTVTGAPKAWAMQFVEDHEKSARGWYGGAVGARRLRRRAQHGAHAAHDPHPRRRRRGARGATLLFDSEPRPRRRRPTSRRRRCSTRSAGRRGSRRRSRACTRPGGGGPAHPAGRPPGLVRAHARQLPAPDRRRGGDVARGLGTRMLIALRPDLVVLSPGPGAPADFDVAGTLAALRERRLPAIRRVPRGRVFITGTQALVRLPMMQRRATAPPAQHRRLHLRLSRLAARRLDQAALAGRPLPRRDTTSGFQPGVNEDLAATAIWGTQQLDCSGAPYDGVFGDLVRQGAGRRPLRRRAQARESRRHRAHGGVLLLAGDDHACKSSTTAHQSEHALHRCRDDPDAASRRRAGVHRLGLYGWAMSRYSGCWVAMKCVADTTRRVGLGRCRSRRASRSVCRGLRRCRRAGSTSAGPTTNPLDRRRLHEHKLPAALAFARANRSTASISTAEPRSASSPPARPISTCARRSTISASTSARPAARPLASTRWRCPGRSSRKAAREFAEGLDEMLVVEEKRG